MAEHDDMAPSRAAMIDRIEDAKFSTTRSGGYDEVEVDKFLDLIVKDFRRGIPVNISKLRSPSLSTRCWPRSPATLTHCRDQVMKP